MKSTTLVAALAAVSLLALAACGGGGGGGPVTGVNQTVRDLAGLSAPAETYAAQTARSPSIISRSDSLIISTISGESTHPDLPPFRLHARCSGTRCTMREPRTGYSYTTYLSDFRSVEGPVETVGSKHGVTLMSLATRTEGVDFVAWGAWMNHSGFQARTQSVVVQGYRVNLRDGVAGGDLTGTPPVGGATWQGLMVGTPVDGNRRGDRLVGIAALNYDSAAGPVLDIAFSNIVNLDQGASHEIRTVMFQDVPMNSRGTFEAGLAGNRIQGGFYGPGHAEAAGIFEQSNIVGAFGAKKQ